MRLGLAAIYHEGPAFAKLNPQFPIALLQVAVRLVLKNREAKNMVRKSKNTDPGTAQPSAHFRSMRAHQHAAQSRDYEKLVAFSHMDVLRRQDTSRAGVGLAPVAVFIDHHQRETVLPARALHRLVRLAATDARYEAHHFPKPGPASVFLELAQRPYEQLMAEVRKPPRPGPN